MMQVIQGDRGFGKTTTLIEWLLRGDAIRPYPGWSRIIVCITNDETLRVTGLVRKATAGFDLDKPTAPIPDLNLLKDIPLETTLADLRKAVWTVGEWQRARGVFQGIEYGFDNFDWFLQTLCGSVGVPTVVTVSGEWEVTKLADQRPRSR